jgi:glycosyltransferase involved in cell wall biosynthesis
LTASSMPSVTSPTGKLKVVVMLDSLGRPGGGERLAIEGAIRLEPARFTRSLCLTRWDAAFERDEPARTLLARLREANVRVIGLPRRNRADLWAWLPLVRALRRERVDVLHAHLFGSNLWASVLGRVAGVPAIVAHEHMWAYTGGGVRPFLDRELIGRLSDAFVAVSEEGRRRMIEVERIRPDHVALIPNGIPPLRDGDGGRVRAELGIPSGAPVVGSVGHLRPEKAYEVLIEAAALISAQDQDVHVVIAGEGGERDGLEQLRAQLGLRGSVHLVGARDDVPDLLAAFDVGVCCSDSEGGPLSVMEYMAAGLPVVASDVGGLPELVHDGDTGILVPPRDPGALAAAVAGLLADRGRREELGASARELVRTEYGIDRWVERLEALYASLLARAEGRRWRSWRHSASTS